MVHVSIARRRHEDAGALVDLFVASAATTVIAVRALLAATGYPRVGGHGLHVAHVLWGGLAMGCALVVVLMFADGTALRIAATLGGTGFGLFLDEVGKFLTAHGDYLFRPALPTIYVGLVLLTLLSRWVRPHEARRPIRTGHSSRGAAPAGPLESLSIMLLGGLGAVAIVGEAAAWTVGAGTVLDPPIVGIVGSALASASFVAAGMARLPRSRRDAIAWFRRAVGVHLLVGEVFLIYLAQATAIPGLFVSLVAYGGFTLLLGREAGRATDEAPGVERRVAGGQAVAADLVLTSADGRS